MKVVFCAYRKWAADILEKLLLHQGGSWHISDIVTVSAKELDFRKYHANVHEIDPASFKDGRAAELFRSLKPDMILFYGWSWIVKRDVLDVCDCVVLHPSPLPKYRGGSPIQNQIIAGEKNSAVSLIKMADGIDNGDVYKQAGFSLEGDLGDILERIADVGAKLTVEMLDEAAGGSLTSRPQDESKATMFRRRTPAESEITPEEIVTRPAEYIYNKIRMLQDPYPNAFIKTSDGKKIYITKARLGE